MYYESHELYHHGIKGMHWGVRRFQNADGSLTEKGKKHYALKGYAEDSYNRNKTKIGKAYDRFTGAHKIAGEIEYNSSSKDQRDARANKYVKDHNSDDSLKTESKRDSSSNHADYNKAHDKSKKVNSMSNAELKEINKRLNMEQEYKRLSSNDTKTGKDYINSVIKAGTTIASVTSTALTIYNNYDKIKKIINKING